MTVIFYQVQVAADKAMNAAVNAAGAAREAKELASVAADIARVAIEKSGICDPRQRNFSQIGSMCTARRPRVSTPTALNQRYDDDGQSDWNEFGFYAPRFDAKTIYTENVQIMSHLHFDHLVSRSVDEHRRVGRHYFSSRRDLIFVFRLHLIRHSSVSQERSIKT